MRGLFLWMASNTWLRERIPRLPFARKAVRRFMPGEEPEDALQAGAVFKKEGIASEFTRLGENVTRADEADAVAAHYLEMMDRISAAGLDGEISVKLTQLGLDIDRAICLDNLRRILSAADKCGFFVRVDMESSSYTEVTLQIVETVWRHGNRQVGVVLQSCLYRTEQDLERMNTLGSRIRLVKGAYREPKTVAHQKKSDVDAAYLRLAKRLLTESTYPAIATHDEQILDGVKRFAAERGIAPETYEFQMLYGVRRDLQTALVREGHRMRVYVPFGKEWFPYFMRRLGERPANVAFVLRSLIAER